MRILFDGSMYEIADRSQSENHIVFDNWPTTNHSDFSDPEVTTATPASRAERRLQLTVPNISWTLAIFVEETRPGRTLGMVDFESRL